MTTPNSTISEPYKHLTIAKAYIAQQIAPWRSAIFGCGQFRTFRPGFGQRYNVDRHGQLTLKQLRLSVLNEMHTNSYSGPRLCGLKNFSSERNVYATFSRPKLAASYLRRGRKPGLKLAAACKIN